MFTVDSRPRRLFNRIRWPTTNISYNCLNPVSTYVQRWMPQSEERMQMTSTDQLGRSWKIRRGISSSSGLICFLCQVSPGLCVKSSGFSGGERARPIPSITKGSSETTCWRSSGYSALSLPQAHPSMKTLAWVNIPHT